jgi:predicted dehydrogenase
LYGSNGLAEISRPDMSRLRFAPMSTTAPTGRVPAPPDEIFEHSGFDTLRAELTAFARAIRGGESYPVPLDDVLHGMAVFDALIESAEIGDIVEVSRT